MRALSRSRRRAHLAGVAGCAALAFGLTGAVYGSPDALAQVRGILPVVNRHAAVSWGLNDLGQLGDGSTANRALYGGVSGLGTGVVQVSAGDGFALAVTSAGTVWAWGHDDFGQLGDGSVTDSTTPVEVMGLTAVTQVSAGENHGLALRSDGTVWAWGNNSYGELGNGVTSLLQLTPVEVKGLTGVTRISAGDGFSLALRSDGTVWAWGRNADGELGNGTTAGSSVPVKVSGLSQVTSISAGAEASLAIRTSSLSALTSAWTWGGNADGELGDGTFTNYLVPEQVRGISAPGIAGVSSGGFFATVLGTDGSVWCWGLDVNGQLGNAPSSVPVLRPREAMGAGSTVIQLAAGDNGHVLALRSDGTVLAWGANGAGQLGVGDTVSHIGPVQVTGLSDASQVSAGSSFSLAVYLPPQVIQS